MLCTRVVRVYMCASEHNLSIDMKIFKNPFTLTPPIINIHQSLDSYFPEYNFMEGLFQTKYFVDLTSTSYNGHAIHLTGSTSTI